MVGLAAGLLARGALLGAIAVWGAGCAEQTLIRTAPPNASVYVNGTFIGVSPVRYRVPEYRFSPHTTYRIEREGYQPLEGELRTYTAPGRIIGGIMGLGIPFAFRGVTAFRKNHDFELQPSTTAAAGRPLVRPIEAPAAAAGQSAPAIDEAASKLRQLQDLHERGLISDEEYRATRARIMRGL